MNGTVHGRAELKNQVNGVAARGFRKARRMWLRPLHVRYVVLCPSESSKTRIDRCFIPPRESVG